MLHEDNEWPGDVLKSGWRRNNVKNNEQRVQQQQRNNRNEELRRKDNHVVNDNARARQQLVRIGIGTVVPAVSRSCIGNSVRATVSDSYHEQPCQCFNKTRSSTIARARVEGASRAGFGRRHERHQPR